MFTSIGLRSLDVFPSSVCTTDKSITSSLCFQSVLKAGSEKSKMSRAEDLNRVLVKAKA